MVLKIVIDNEIQTEFESLYQFVLKSFPVMANEDKDELKTKLSNILRDMEN